MRRTRVIFFCSFLLTVFIYTKTRQSSLIEFNLFDNAYELQQQTGYNLGFPSIMQSRIYGVAIRSSVDDIEFQCDDGFLSISTEYGIIDGGQIFCAVSEFGDIRKASDQTNKVIKSINSSELWRLEYDKLNSPRRHELHGRTVKDAFTYLTEYDTTSHGAIARVPLLGWRSVTNRSTINISATIHYREGDNRLRYEIYYRSHNSCFDDIAKYESYSKSGELDIKKYPNSDVLRKLFSGRIYVDIPDKERVALTHKYVNELCENTWSWN